MYNIEILIQIAINNYQYKLIGHFIFNLLILQNSMNFCLKKTFDTFPRYFIYKYFNILISCIQFILSVSKYIFHFTE